MRLLEFQAKRLFAQQDIAVPNGVLVRQVSELKTVSYPVVLKAQVPVGGRGKAGTVQTVSSVAEAGPAAARLLSSKVKGHAVQALLAEEICAIEKEYYIACLSDAQVNRPMIMASRAGGTDVEMSTRESTDNLEKRWIDPLVGVQAYDVRALAKALALADINGLAGVVNGIWRLFRQYDATLVEINPLAQTPRGLMALDAKIVLDDKAAFRQAPLFQSLDNEQITLNKKKLHAAEALALEKGITYVPLDGNIGIIADGAGTGMLTLDMVKDSGRFPANFCEMGGMAAEEAARQAVEVVLANERVKVLLISLIGGMTRMDHIAAGIAAYVRINGMPVPMVARMCGTKAEVGILVLQEIGVQVFEDLAEAVRAAVQIENS